MKILNILGTLLVHAYYERASREIDRQHSDVLHVELKRLAYRAKLERLFSAERTA